MANIWLTSFRRSQYRPQNVLWLHRSSHPRHGLFHQQLSCHQLSAVTYTTVMNDYQKYYSRSCFLAFLPEYHIEKNRHLPKCRLSLIVFGNFSCNSSDFSMSFYQSLSVDHGFLVFYLLIQVIKLQFLPKYQMPEPSLGIRHVHHAQAPFFKMLISRSTFSVFCLSQKPGMPLRNHCRY